MDCSEFKSYVTHIRNTEKLLGNGKKKPTLKEKSIMLQVRRSILASRDLKEGTVLTEDMLCLKRPGTGIEPVFLPILIGRKIKRDLKEDDILTWEDV